MKEPLHPIELIERYFDNELTQEELDQFRSHLKENHGLQKLFDQEKLLISTVRFQAAQKDLKFLEEVEQSLRENKTIYFRKHWYYYAAAACVAFLAIVLVWNRWEKENPDTLFALHFKPHPNVFEPSLRTGANAGLRSQAFAAYEQGNYEQASHAFTELLQDDHNDDAGMILLLGNSNLMLGKTKEAIENFGSLLLRHNELQVEAKWYLSLCYLKSAQMSEAQRLLTEISETKTAYSGEATELLKKLE
jgi:tetratricopeptide (TPR) repeat protein